MKNSAQSTSSIIHSLYATYQQVKTAGLLDISTFESLVDSVNNLYDNNPDIWDAEDPLALEELSRLSSDLETLRHHFTPSSQTRRQILELGLYLCSTLEWIEAAEAFIAFDRSHVVFMKLVEDYYNDTNTLPEDLGISLGEAKLMKIDALKNHTSQNEWRNLLNDERERLNYDALILSLNTANSASTRSDLVSHLKTKANLLKTNPELSPKIAYSIAGLMATEFVSNLSSSDPIDEVLTIAGELEAEPANSGTLREELISKIEMLY